MKKWLTILSLALATCLMSVASAQTPDFRVNTPAVNAVRDSLKARFAQIKPYLESGVLGVGQNGQVLLRDPAAAPLAQRQTINRLLSEQDRDRKALFREIARANGHPEWEQQIADTFAERMRQRLAKLPKGWWVQDASGQWRQQ